MYLNFFGLTEQPFQLTPDSHFLYLSGGHMRAKAYMDYTVWRRDGFVVITGEIGAGKTTLIHKLLSEVEGDVKLIRIFQTQLDEVEFLQAMLVELDFDSGDLKDRGKVELLSLLNTYLLESYSQGKHIVLIVDEAQNLSPKVLEEIRMLSGLESEKEKILNIILVGQPELNDTLSRPDMEQLVQRIRLRFHVGALSQDETWEYIVHRLKIAGCTDGDIFAKEVLSVVYRYTGGIPRKINILCDTALICAFADSVKCVDETVMQEAIGELQWQPVATKPHKSMQSHGEQSVTAAIDAALRRQNEGKAPAFSAGHEQWADLFSLVLRLLGDMSSRMGAVDEKLQRLESLLEERRGPDAIVSDDDDEACQEWSDDIQDGLGVRPATNVHLAQKK
ncbi:MAG: AAA family ATPase [Gammaproteobacteria bacterium]|nr:AAA family ATPase [Gammaproteobacteria bacterium]